MTDRELLEKAARAAGVKVVRSRLDDLHTDEPTPEELHIFSYLQGREDALAHLPPDQRPSISE